MGSLARTAHGPAVTGAAVSGSRPVGSDGREIRTARAVDLDRFMGRWYVVACIPTPFARGAYDAVKSYRLADDGSIETTFRFRRRGHHARARTVRMRGIVEDRENNAVWRMRLFGVLLAEYRILAVGPDYRHAVVGRSRRDYAWIMSRTAGIGYRDFFASVRLLREQGYETGRLQRVRHVHGNGVAGASAIVSSGSPSGRAVTIPATE